MREKYSNSPADELAGGKWLFAQGCNFSLGVVSLDGLPTSGEIEIAFAGRSNVGKSSLLNALTGRRGLARTSNTPGRTQELNFFKLAPNRDNGPWLVDMPGYGYARESKTKILAWNKLLNAYLRGRSNLRRAFVLVDSRHGLKPNDLEMFDQFLPSLIKSLEPIKKPSCKTQPTYCASAQPPIQRSFKHRVKQEWA